MSNPNPITKHTHENIGNMENSTSYGLTYKITKKIKQNQLKPPFF
jgi:hypothetical protein